MRPAGFGKGDEKTTRHEKRKKEIVKEQRRRTGNREGKEETGE